MNWRVLHKCTYQVDWPIEEDCGCPAIARVWWDSYDDYLFVCQEHFDFLLNNPVEGDNDS